jgi:uncharacterized protein with HEPN domain
MQGAGQRAIEFCRGQSLEALKTDSMFQAALERALEIVGEASRNVSNEFKAAHPEIRWVQIAKTRHILVHNYDDVDYEILWRIATEHLPVTMAQIEPILKANPPQ